MTEFDFLIVGSGLFGAVFAHECRKAGKKVLVIDRRQHSGGNVYCENVNGVNVHKYGAHIFHTNDKPIWDYVNSFVTFNNYVNSPLAVYKDELYNLPFNMNTFHQLWKVKTPQEAKAKIAEQVAALHISDPQNLEEQALSLVGVDIYEKLIRGYTEKQWGRKASELPAFIIKRLPLRFTYNNNYFNDKYQGIPVGGYNLLIAGLLEGIEVRLNTDFFSAREELSALAKTVVFTGQLDEFYNYRFGMLEYRSLRFEHQELATDNYQGNAVVNYTEREVPYTRIIEHKHFEFGQQPTTVITREYPQEWTKGLEPYYPINDDTNARVYKQYKALADKETDVIFGGRLAEYRYYDMHQVVGSALHMVRQHLKTSE
jgi:UDP-galactopyranose mutase